MPGTKSSRPKRVIKAQVDKLPKRKQGKDATFLIKQAAVKKKIAKQAKKKRGGY